MLRKSCVLGDRRFATVPASDFVVKNSPPDCFLNAPHPLGVQKYVFGYKKLSGISRYRIILVRETGLEPVRDYHTPLKRARLPIPPLSHIQLRPSRNDCYYIKVKYICQHFFTNIFKKISGIFLTVPKAQNQKNVAEFSFKIPSSAGVICRQSLL